MIQGLIGRKVGMTQLFQDDGEVVVTAIEAGPCFVIQIKNEAKDGYNAVQLGFGEAKVLSSRRKVTSKRLVSSNIFGNFKLMMSTLFR